MQPESKQEHDVLSSSRVSTSLIEKHPVVPWLPKHSLSKHAVEFHNRILIFTQFKAEPLKQQSTRHFVSPLIQLHALSSLPNMSSFHVMHTTHNTQLSCVLQPLAQFSWRRHGQKTSTCVPPNCSHSSAWDWTLHTLCAPNTFKHMHSSP